MPAITHPEELLAWMTPDDMLERPIGKDAMLSSTGPAPATTVPLPNPASTNTAVLPPIAQLETFDSSQRYFGGIFANCVVALNAAIPHVAIPSTPMPAGTLLPDYNMDSDRGYAWPCWDVDYKTMLPWNGCDPFPADTISRAGLSGLGALDWGTQSPPPQQGFGLNGTDPFGNPRSGTAFVNASALSTPGVCDVAKIPFPLITIDPTQSTLDLCNIPPAAVNLSSPTGNLPFDYRFAPSLFLDGVSTSVTDPNTNTTESEGRLIPFLRSQAQLMDPLKILANAATLSLGAGTTVGPSPIPSTNPEFPSLVKAVAQLAVTGRESFTKFAATPPQDADVVAAAAAANPGSNFPPAALAAAAHSVLDMAYTALWAIRANDSGWRSSRFGLGWIAVSGVDDTPHRPVNVPTAPYPQFDITFDVSRTDGSTFPVTTRFMVASANAFVGPNDQTKSSLTNPNPGVLQTPAGVAPTPSMPAPRTVPQGVPSIPAGNEIIVYIHGGGSRAEEAVGLGNWLIISGLAAGKSYTVISFDMPNSAYGGTYQVTDVVGGSYDPSALAVVDFEEQYVINFIEALDQQLGNVKSRVVAVMGGSLGGNMSLLLSSKNDASHQYLNTVVAWSATSLAPSTYLHFIPNGPVAAYIGGLKAQATNAETPSTEATYIQNMYFKPLVQQPLLPFVPAQPIMWYRGDDFPPTTSPSWKACKESFIAQSRFDRYEIYSDKTRDWTSALDLELVYLSFQDNCRYQSIASSPSSRLLLCAGAKDNFDPVDIYNSTLDVARLMARTAHGKAEFWLETGHSFHDERPNLFANEIVYFLNNLDSGDSPNGQLGSPTTAPPSRTDE